MPPARVCLHLQVCFAQNVQAAKTAGSTLKAFKPTLDELSTVSQDLRKTFDEELGINEIRNEFRSVVSVMCSWRSCFRIHCPCRTRLFASWSDGYTLGCRAHRSHRPAAARSSRIGTIWAQR